MASTHALSGRGRGAYTARYFRYYKGGKPDLQLFDERFETINPDDKVAVARAAAEEF